LSVLPIIQMNYSLSHSATVAEAPSETQALFLKRTYLHLAGALFCFFAIEFFLFRMGLADRISSMMAGGRMAWLLVIVGFVGISWIADKWARSDVSDTVQYAGLSLYVVAEALIMVPMLKLATMVGGPTLIFNAGALTLALFLGLTVYAFTSKSNFSWMRGALCVGGIVALGAIVLSLIFGFTLGVWFSAAMVLFAAGSILYTTGNLIHEYRPQQHVAASLALFAAVALLFWHILRILTSLGCVLKSLSARKDWATGSTHHEVI
jgi:FtsH-binding integral membrane protein